MTEVMPSKTNTIISQLDINDKEIDIIIQKISECKGLIDVICTVQPPETDAEKAGESDGGSVVFNRLKHQFWQLRRINEIIEDMVSRIQL